MLGRILFVGSTAVLLSSCSLLQPFQQSNAQQGYFATKSISDQDPYMRKFYQLEQQIEQLRASNSQLRARLPAQPEQDSKVAQSTAQKKAPDFKTDEVLARVQQQADKAIASIDQAMQKLSQPEQLSQPEVKTVAVVQPVTDTSSADISGELKRDEDGNVVGQTTYSAARKNRYNYSVVYIYPKPEPWNAMWEKLEQAHEQDKWRGFNPDRSSYFIYVGAYFRQVDARERQDALLSLVGEKPDLRQRPERNATLAAK